ncbi:hypothetical protein GDO78_004290 [Eleutherodactylus coqui]|uniref:Uncharacterized protein n=1 Tax=Eleutherodactylus coqui TaxID=57060 RepID=A0A8J6JZJ7_ELECQ|nr:hypothetical protein GDO78_004290 [Eleutherodactylus coqui]
MQGMEHWVFIERRTESSDTSFEDVPKSQTVQVSGQDLSPAREDHMQFPKDREERETEDRHDEKVTEKVVPMVKGVERRIRLTQREERLVMVTGEWDAVESKARTAPDGAPADDTREWAMKMDNVKQGQAWGRAEELDGEEPFMKRTERGMVASGSSARPHDRSRTIVELGESRRVILCDDDEDADDSADETEGEWNNDIHWEDQHKTLIWCESSGYQQPKKPETVEETDMHASSQHRHEQMQSSLLNGRKEESQQDETVKELFREYVTTDILMPDDHIEEVNEDGCVISTDNTEEVLTSRLPNELMSSSVQMTAERSTEDLPLEDWGPPVLHFMLPTIIPLPVSFPRERGHQEVAAPSDQSERILVQPNPRHHAAPYHEGNASPAESATDTPGDLSSPDSGCEITLTDAAVTLINLQP